jgi:hypothetical protein
MKHALVNFTPSGNVSQTVTRVAVAGGISDGDHSRPAIELF